MARSSVEDTERTRTNLLAAARKLFELKGFSGTTTAEICSDAHVTKGALFHHFKTKELLFKEIWLAMETEVDTMAAAAALRIVAETQDPYTGFLAGCRTYLEQMSRSEFQQVINIDGPVVLGTAEWSKLDAGFGLRNIGGGLRMLESEGLIDPSQRRALTMLLYSALQGSALLLTHKGEKTNIDDLIVVIEDILRCMTPQHASNQ